MARVMSRYFRPVTWVAPLRCGGIDNPAALCFLNAIFQAFAASTSTRDFFRRLRSHGPLIDAFADLFESIECGRTTSTRVVRRELEALGCAFGSRTQEDVHESMLRLSNTLSDLLVTGPGLPVGRPSLPYRFVIRESIRCTHCGHVADFVEAAFCVVMPVQSGSVEAGMRDYFGATTLISRCDACGRLCDRERVREIVVRPSLFLIWVSRRASVDVLPLTTAFTYPPFLELEQHCVLPRRLRQRTSILRAAPRGLSEIFEDPGWRLVAVSVFDGVDRAGHYQAYRRCERAGPAAVANWVLTNDARVTSSSLSEALGQEMRCVLLAYES